MSELWHLRIHLGEYKSEEIYNFLVTCCDVILCVFESHNNRPHIHTLFKETLVTKSTVIQKLVKQFPSIKGNGNYSCSKTDKLKKKGVGDDEKAKCYLCKGEGSETLPVIIGDTKIDYKQYHADYWLANSVLKAKSEVNMGCQNDPSLFVKAKSKTKSWSEKVYGEMLEIYEVEVNTIILYYDDVKPSDELIRLYDESRRILFRYMMKCLGKNVKKINENIIRDLWQGFLNAILQGHESAGEKYSDKLFNSLVLKH